jgi:hypothetical protein
MPFGFALLTLQYIVDLYCLATGREPPFPSAGSHEAEKEINNGGAHA